MPSLHLESVSFSHVDALAILEDASLVLSPGWTGVVGPNGAGKSTLLDLLAGELLPQQGRVRCEPSGARVLRCRQTAEQLEPGIAAFGAAYDRASIRWRARLELDEQSLERWPSLSPGERRRWQVGAALAGEPDALLLDEPTDHLDGDARDVLVNALRRFDGVGVVVSHDRTLLDALTDRTVRVEHAQLALVRGAYATARQEWDAEASLAVRRREALRKEEKRTRRRLQTRREQLDRAEGNLSTRKRAKGRQDRDQRTMAAKNRAQRSAASAAHQVHLLKAQAERAARRTGEVQVTKELGRSLFVDFEPARVPVLLALRTAELRAGDRRVLGETDLQLRRDDRVWVHGRNGAGKSTLLRALLGSARVSTERLLHLPQELTAQDAQALLAETRSLGEEDRGRVLSVLAALGADPDRVLASARLSPGEARKLAIAWGLGRRVVGVVLDEPTNHLDVASIERLEEALVAYPGALALVTHDETLARRCASTRWHVAEGAVEVTGVPSLDAATGR